MASDFLLKIDNIKGESAQAGYPDWIEVASWNWGESQTGTMHAGAGGGAGKVSMQDFSFSSPMSSATADLVAKCANGEHLKKVELHARKAGGKQEVFLKLLLENCLVSSYSTGGSGDVPMETFSINFQKIKMEYFKQDAKGAMTAAGIMTYDMKAGKKV